MQRSGKSSFSGFSCREGLKGNEKSTWWIITVIGVAVIAAVIFFMMKPGQEAKHTGKVKTNQDAKDELLVSFTDQKLNNTYYLHDRALHTEKLTAYPSIAYDSTKQVLYYTYTDEDTQKVSIRELNVKSDEEKHCLRVMILSTV